jgi:hypothetical protein
MKRFLGLCTAAFFLSVLPGAGFAQTSSGVPPMLETQRPLAMPANQQPEPRAPQPEVAKPVCPAAPVVKSKKSTRKTCAVGAAKPNSAKKVCKTARKKGAASAAKSKNKVVTKASAL